MSLRVLIAEYDPALRDEIRELVGSEEGCEIVGLARDGQEAIQMAMQHVPHVAFISQTLPGIPGFQTCEMLNVLDPNILSVVVAEANSQAHIRDAMLSSARAFVARPLDTQQFGSLISELTDARERRESPELLEWKDPLRFPKVVSVTGAKGGVGKTTLAVNLAVILAKRLPSKVALIDLYTQFGDVATMFNISPKRAIADLVRMFEDLDMDLIQECVTRHGSGVHVLVTSVHPLPFDAVPIESLDKLLSILKRAYRYLIIDVPPVLDRTTMHVLTHSNVILLVSNLFDLTTAADTRKFYDALQRERVSKDNIKVVLNRVARANKLCVADMERTFGCSLVQIPNDSRLVHAVNQGIPLVLSDTDCSLTQSVIRLAEIVTGWVDESAHASKESFLKKILGRNREG